MPADHIVGLWETYYNLMYGYMEFFENRVCIIDDVGSVYSGVWTKIDDRHYVINYNKSVGKGSTSGSASIVLNEDLNSFHKEDGIMIFVKNVTPSTTLNATITPAPTLIPIPVDAMIGLWEGHRNSVNYSIECFPDETLIYDNGGNIATGWWTKTDAGRYRLTILSSVREIALYNGMTQFNYGNGVIFTKKGSITSSYDQHTPPHDWHPT